MNNSSTPAPEKKGWFNSFTNAVNKVLPGKKPNSAAPASTFSFGNAPKAPNAPKNGANTAFSFGNAVKAPNAAKVNNKSKKQGFNFGAPTGNAAGTPAAPVTNPFTLPNTTKGGMAPVNFSYGPRMQQPSEEVMKWATTAGAQTPSGPQMRNVGGKRRTRKRRTHRRKSTHRRRSSGGRRHTKHSRRHCTMKHKSRRHRHGKRRN